MRTRTRLTTPPGQEPATPHATGDNAERYVPALAVPTEPDHPGRFRRLGTVLGSIALLIVLGYVALLVVTSGQSFDPALNRGTDAGDQVIEQTTP